jgi:hypothetical protein
MHAHRSLGRLAAILTAGALALGLSSCSGASTPAPAATPAPADTSTPEVVVVPEVTAEPEAASAEAAPAKTVFYVNRPFKGDPGLLLTRITKQPEGLKLDFVFTNKDSAAITIKVAPAGDENAMFVELLDGRRLEFKSADGISIKPERDTVEPGGRQRFSVTFEPLPEGETKFHVYEGAGAKNAQPGNSQYWLFRNIELR